MLTGGAAAGAMPAMCYDRIKFGMLAMSHEFLWLMSNVRCPGAVKAIKALGNTGFVNGRRGVITLAARQELEKYAADSSGGPEAVYERLIG